MRSTHADYWDSVSVVCILCYECIHYENFDCTYSIFLLSKKMCKINDLAVLFCLFTENLFVMLCP